MPVYACKPRPLAPPPLSPKPRYLRFLISIRLLYHDNSSKKLKLEYIVQTIRIHKIHKPKTFCCLRTTTGQSRARLTNLSTLAELVYILSQMSNRILSLYHFHHNCQIKQVHDKGRFIKQKVLHKRFKAVPAMAEAKKRQISALNWV